MRLFFITSLVITSLACYSSAAQLPTAAASSPAPKAQATTQIQMTVAAERLYLRECPGTKCAAIVVLHAGDVVVFTDTPPVTLYVHEWREVTVDVMINDETVNLTGWLNTVYILVKS